MQGEQGMDLLGNAPDGQNSDITTDGIVGSDQAVDSQIVPQPTCMNHEINIVVDDHTSNEDEFARQLHKELNKDADVFELTFSQTWYDLISMISLFFFNLCYYQGIGHFELVDIQPHVASRLVLPYARAFGFAVSCHSFGQTLLLILYKNTLYYLGQSGYMQQYIKTCMQRGYGQTPETNNLKNRCSEKYNKYFYDGVEIYYNVACAELVVMHAIYDISVTTHSLIEASLDLTLLFSIILLRLI